VREKQCQLSREEQERNNRFPPRFDFQNLPLEAFHPNVRQKQQMEFDHRLHYFYYFYLFDLKIFPLPSCPPETFAELQPNLLPQHQPHSLAHLDSFFSSFFFLEE